MGTQAGVSPAGRLLLGWLHPVWYLDLTASPEVTLQDGANVYEMAAREADGDERERWLALAVDAWPAYAEYQTKTERHIPVVVLEHTR